MIFFSAGHCFTEIDSVVAIIGEHHLQIETDGQYYVNVESVLRACIQYNPGTLEIALFGA